MNSERNERSFRWVVGAIAGRRFRVAIVFLLIGIGFYWLFIRLPRPPDKNLVATYHNGKVTTEELRAYLHEFLPRCSKHSACKSHGEEHDECESNEPCEKFTGCSEENSHAGTHGVNLYQRALVALLTDRLIAKRVEEKMLAQRGETKHLLKHVGEELSLKGLDKNLHNTEMRVDTIKIRGYYEKNIEKFNGKTLSEVSPLIKKILSQNREENFLKDYIRKLREEAVTSVNYELLKWPEPSEDEIREYYAEISSDLIRPERVRVLLVSFPDTRIDKNRIREVRSKLIGGESSLSKIKLLSEKSPDSKVSIQWLTKKSQLSDALSLNRYSPGEVTNIAKFKGKYYIARLEKRETRRQMSFEEAKQQLRAKVAVEEKQRFLKENDGSTLFAVRGKPYSLGEFWREFQELSLSEQKRYVTYEQMKVLLDKLIDRTVLVEKADENIPGKKNRKEYERVRRSVLKQLLHQEEVDDQLKISEQDAKVFFENNRNYYRQTARVKVSYIRVNAGGNSPDNLRKAQKKAEKARKELKKSPLNDVVFAEVAQKYSDAPDVKKTGGKIERWITETDNFLNEMLAHEFHKNVLLLKKGEISTVFQMGKDFYIVMVREREEPIDKQFKEVRTEVMEDIKIRKHKQLTYKMEMELLSKAKVKIYDYTILKMMEEDKNSDKEKNKD